MYLEGKSYQAIANILNKEKVLYPEKKRWIDSTIDRTKITRFIWETMKDTSMIVVEKQSYIWMLYHLL